LRDDLKVFLGSLLDEELQLYTDLDVLVGQEESCVEGEDMDALLEVLRRKQALISRQEGLLDRWGDVARELGVLEGREGLAFWASVRAGVSSLAGESGYNDLVGKVEEIRRRASCLLDRERRVQGVMEESLGRMRARLLQMRQGRNALKGYGGSGG
jgi:hypothetical protein